jgi:hypothetical protein
MNADAPRFRLAQIAALLAGVVALACVAGCASAGANVDVKQPPTTSLSKYKTVELNVTTKDLDFKVQQLTQLTSRIVDGLRKSGQFDQVSTNSAVLNTNASLKLAVEVQLVIGPNTGHVQSIETVVVLADASSGETVARANVNSHTAWSLLGGNMTKTVNSLGDQIVDFAIKP